MKFLSRFIGTWALGLALILLVVDGTRSLAASGIVTSSLSQLWVNVHAQSYQDLTSSMAAEPLNGMWSTLESTLFAWPAWSVLGVLGFILAMLGRRKTSRMERLSEI